MVFLFPGFAVFVFLLWGRNSRLHILQGAALAAEGGDYQHVLNILNIRRWADFPIEGFAVAFASDIGNFTNN